MTDSDRVRRLKWLCRRGMKELDLLLTAFVRSQEAGLNRGDWPDFEALLALEDDVLWDYLQSPALAPDSFSALIEDIRGHHVPAN